MADLRSHGHLRHVTWVRCTGSEVAQEAAAGVLRLCAVVDNNKSSIIWAKAVEPLVDCMNLWNEGIREQAAGALRNLATWQTIDDSITEVCLRSRSMWDEHAFWPKQKE